MLQQRDSGLKLLGRHSPGMHFTAARLASNSRVIRGDARLIVSLVRGWRERHIAAYFIKKFPRQEAFGILVLLRGEVAAFLREE